MAPTLSRTIRCWRIRKDAWLVNEAIRLLGLRDYAELLVALGDADLPLPLPPPHDVENQAVTFAKLWKQS